MPRWLIRFLAPWWKADEWRERARQLSSEERKFVERDERLKGIEARDRLLHAESQYRMRARREH